MRFIAYIEKSKSNCLFRKYLLENVKVSMLNSRNRPALTYVTICRNLLYTLQLILLLICRNCSRNKTITFSDFHKIRAISHYVTFYKNFFLEISLSFSP